MANEEQKITKLAKTASPEETKAPVGQEPQGQTPQGQTPVGLQPLVREKDDDVFARQMSERVAEEILADDYAALQEELGGPKRAPRSKYTEEEEEEKTQDAASPVASEVAEAPASAASPSQEDLAVTSKNATAYDIEKALAEGLELAKNVGVTSEDVLPPHKKRYADNGSEIRDDLDSYYWLANKALLRLEKPDRFPEYYYAHLSAGENTLYQKHLTETKYFDDTWIRALERYLPSLNVIFKDPKSALKYERDVVAIEKIKKVSSEAVRHLASHSQFVTEVHDDGTVMPKKLLNVYAEIDYSIYENRFVKTLVNRLFYFVRNRLEIIRQNVESSQRDHLAMHSVYQIENDEVTMSLDINVKRDLDDKSINAHNRDLLARAERLGMVVGGYRNTPFMKELKNAALVHPPIMKTNIILHNPYFKDAYDCWLFLDQYKILGYNNSIEEKDLDVSKTFEANLKQALLVSYSAFEANLIAREADYFTRPTREVIEHATTFVSELPPEMEEKKPDLVEMEDYRLNEYLLSALKGTFDGQVEDLVKSQRLSRLAATKRAMKRLETIVDALYKTDIQADTSGMDEDALLKEYQRELKVAKMVTGVKKQNEDAAEKQEADIQKKIDKILAKRKREAEKKRKALLAAKKKKELELARIARDKARLAEKKAKEKEKLEKAKALEKARLAKERAEAREAAKAERARRRALEKEKAKEEALQPDHVLAKQLAEQAGEKILTDNMNAIVEELGPMKKASSKKPSKTEEPKSEEPKAEEPMVEEPKAEEPKAEEPKAEEPKAEEPKAEEPKAEEPKAEEPKAEEPKAEEPKVEEPKAEESKAEEPKPEEPKPEEPKPEEPKSEEPKPEEPKPEEPMAEEPKPEEPKPEEPKPEEPKPEEPKAEEPKPEEPKAEESKPKKEAVAETQSKPKKSSTKPRAAKTVVGKAPVDDKKVAKAPKVKKATPAIAPKAAEPVKEAPKPEAAQPVIAPVAAEPVKEAPKPEAAQPVIAPVAAEPVKEAPKPEAAKPVIAPKAAEPVKEAPKPETAKPVIAPKAAEPVKESPKPEAVKPVVAPVAAEVVKEAPKPEAVKPVIVSVPKESQVETSKETPASLSALPSDRASESEKSSGYSRKTPKGPGKYVHHKKGYGYRSKEEKAAVRGKNKEAYQAKDKGDKE